MPSSLFPAGISANIYNGMIEMNWKNEAIEMEYLTDDERELLDQIRR